MSEVIYIFLRLKILKIEFEYSIVGKLLSGTFESRYSFLLFMKLGFYHYFPSANMASNVKATKRLLT